MKFQALAPRGLVFAPATKYARISGALALDKSKFFYAVVLVALVWLCDSFAAKCGKVKKNSRKCAAKNIFCLKN